MPLLTKEYPIFAEMTPQQKEHLAETRKYKNLEFFTSEDLEQKDYYILINKNAFLCRGNYKGLIADHVRANTAYGAAKIDISKFPYCISTRSKLLMQGYNITIDLKDDRLPYVKPFPSMKQVKIVPQENPDLVEDL